MKCALVTGASRGIGRAVGITLAKDHGYHILINYAGNEKAALESKQLIEELGGTAELMKFDVSNKAEVDKNIEAWYAAHPDDKLEVVVNNAGVTRDGLLAMMDEQDWDLVLDTSLKGMYNVTKATVYNMMRSRYGRIINMVSLSGMAGTAGQFNYSAAKGGMIAATKALAQEIGKRKVTVNAVAPGFIRSDMTEDLDEASLKKMIPAQRFGETQEVADLVSFLASDKAGYINGNIVNINGGLYT